MSSVDHTISCGSNVELPIRFDWTRQTLVSPFGTKSQPAGSRSLLRPSKSPYVQESPRTLSRSGLRPPGWLRGRKMHASYHEYAGWKRPVIAVAVHLVRILPYPIATHSVISSHRSMHSRFRPWSILCHALRHATSPSLLLISRYPSRHRIPVDQEVEER